MKKFIQSNSFIFLAIIVGLSVFFFVSVSSFNYVTQDKDFVKWLSPDETANYVLTKLYGQEGRMEIFEKYNLYVDDIMKPRSFRSDRGEIKPVSFLGIILVFGTLVKFSTYKIIPYLTPLFASIGIVYYYLLIKKLFNKNIAFVSAVLLVFFPVYTYYSARSMFHNVLFTVFLVVGLFYSYKMTEGFELQRRKSIRRFIKSIFRKKNKDDFIEERRERGPLKIFFGAPKYKAFTYLAFSALAGAFVGLAVIVRTSELMWIAPLFLVLWVFNFRRVGALKLAVFSSFFILALLPMFFYNQVLYSSPFLGGYSEMNQSILNIKDAGTEIVKNTLSGEVGRVDGPIEKLSKSIFYFGLQPKQSLLRFKYYFVNMFPWIFWTAFLGGIVFFVMALRNRRKKYFVYLLSYIIISSILVIYYGSWGFTDNPDPNSFTIGNSYTRYWLPVYLGSFPLAAVFVLSVAKLLSLPFPHKLENNKWKNIYLRSSFVKWVVVSLFLSITAIVSIRFVLHGSEEGLIYTAENQANANREVERVLELTEPNSAIITLYHDKLLFPERKVVVGLFDDKEMITRYYRIASYVPLYYYNFRLPQKDINYLNKRRLAEFDLSIEEVSRISGDFTLYRIEKVKEVSEPEGK